MTETALPTPSRLARLGIGLGLRPTALHSIVSHRPFASQADADWYIPYNGPYEQPRDKGKGRAHPHSSAHDLIDEDDPFRAHRRPVDSGRAGPAAAPADDERRGRSRGRAISGASRSSATGVGLAERRLGGASVQASPRARARAAAVAPSFLSLDLSGTGIGESPVPVQRAHGAPTDPPARSSLGSLWSFGQTNRKSGSGSASSGAHDGWPRASTSTQHTAPTQTLVQRRDRAATVGASDWGHDRDGDRERERERAAQANTPSLPPWAGVAPGRSRTASSAVPQVSSAPHFQQNWPARIQDGQPVAGSSRDVVASNPYRHSPHPYALAFPGFGRREPMSVPRTPASNPTPGPSDLGPPFLTVTAPSTRSSRNHIPAHLENTSFLKASISAPNLRAMSARQAEATAASQPGTASWMDRWFSAETWCDALIFPRPRFRARPAQWLSPPGSPVHAAPPGAGAVAEFSRIGQSHSQPPSQMRMVVKKSSHTEVQLRAASTESPSLVLSPAATDGHGRAGSVRPPRPKSFAQDDLALPSPAPSLARVLKEGEILQKQRMDWNRQATHSFQNKRSRSLSRTRIHALTQKMVVDKVHKESELQHSFEILASSAFHGHQARKPSISVPSSSSSAFGTASGTGTGTGTAATGTVTGAGTGSSSGHSRKSSEGRSRGHSHKESWSKTALKTAKATANATGMCNFPTDNAASTPVDEKQLAMENAINKEGTKFIKLGAGGPDKGKEKEDDRVMVIAPGQTQSSRSGPRATGLSPTPSAQSQDSSESAIIGFAVSTPSAFVDTNDPISLPGHPYANGGTHRYRDTPRGSDYAGPHPVNPNLADLDLVEARLTDVSLRHRLPPRAVFPVLARPHPYASSESLRLPQNNNLSVNSRMFAEVGSGKIREVLPDELQYSPFSQTTEDFQSNQSNRNSDSLGFEEVLSMSLSGRGNVSNGLNAGRDDAPGAGDVPAVPSFREHKQSPSPPQDTARRSPPRSSDVEEARAALAVQVPEIVAPRPLTRHESSTSQDSSPQGSPRALVIFDESDKYSDLFYNPAKQSTTPSTRRTPPSELIRTFSSHDGSGNGSGTLERSRVSSALVSLGRQLSEEFGVEQGGSNSSSRHEETESPQWGKRLGGLKGERPSEDFPDPNIILRQPSSSPPSTRLPLRLPNSQPRSLEPSLLIPEDVDSNRTSSISDNPQEEGTEDETVFYRFREVPSLPTPDPVGGSRRASAQVTYVGEEADSQPYDGPHRINIPEPDQQRRSGGPGFTPITPLHSASDATTRASYLTSGSSTSHISRLSDFPTPPTLDVMSPTSVLESYLESAPDQHTHDLDLAEARTITQGYRGHRTTFGGEEDFSQLHSSDS